MGEVVLNDFDAHNESVGFRIALSPADVRGRGTAPRPPPPSSGMRLMTWDFTGSRSFNPRARRAYEKAGFTVEGRRRAALLWDGARVDVVSMGILAGDPRPAAPGPLPESGDTAPDLDGSQQGEHHRHGSQDEHHVGIGDGPVPH